MTGKCGKSHKAPACLREILHAASTKTVNPSKHHLSFQHPTDGVDRLLSGLEVDQMAPLPPSDVPPQMRQLRVTAFKARQSRRNLGYTSHHI